MLQWFRLRASSVAKLAIVALVATGAASLGPHEDDCHDERCAIVQHDASAHSIGTRPEGSADQHHCLVCHLARAFRLRGEIRTLTAPVAEARELVHVEYVPAAVGAPLAQPPLRSPPSSPVLF